MADRLLVDLDDDQVTVWSWPQEALPQELSRGPLAWPLDEAALEDLRWYLEDYLLAPFGVWQDRGPAVRDQLAAWGEQVFASVFGAAPARDAYQRAMDRGLGVVFRSADPGWLGLPWELMRDMAGPIALASGGLSRSLPVVGGAGTLKVPGGRLRVLMVISRPGGTADVGYQMVARPLLERLEAVRGEVELTVLRPPTFGALRQAVMRAAEAGEPFHVVHFDGHGGMAAWAGEGVLAFELPGGGSGPVAASRVAAALTAGRVPVVVLNACQSGAMGKELEASVATALLNAGCAAVVAMAYSVYAVAAAEFMAAFYESLFAGTSVGQAVTAGRQRLFSHDERPSLKGGLPLADWLVPVHYLRKEVRFPQARTNRQVVPSLDKALNQIRAAPAEPDAVQDPLEAVGGVLVGRDDLFYQLEIAARSQRVVVLTGAGGTGKTELAKGFARWWRDTGGVDDPRLIFWHSFEPGVASFGLDGVITNFGLAVLGADFARLDPGQRLEAVKQQLAQYQALWVWDNFESVREMPDPAGATPPLDPAGCQALKDFLDWVRDQSRSTVVITSRTPEDWLGQVRRIRVGGLNRAEAAEYADHLLDPYPVAQARRREQRSFGDLLEWLDGHPLAMRLTLPRLDTTGPADLLAALKGTTSMHAADDPSVGRASSLPACITYSYTHLAEQARRLLPVVSLFHGVTDQDILVGFSLGKGVPDRFAGVSQQEWSAMLEDATRVGLLIGMGAGMYRIHPALPGYLAAGWHSDDSVRYTQEREACEQALCKAYAAFSGWLTEQIQSRDAAHAYAVLGWHRRTLGAVLGYALDHHAWADAERIARALDFYTDARGLGEEAAARADRILDATTGMNQTPLESAQSLWLYTTGQRASRQKNAGQPEQASRTYRQVLAYLQDQPGTEWTRFSTGITYRELGYIAYLRGQLAEAGDWYRQALAINEDLVDHRGLALTYHQLGMTAFTNGQLSEAEDWYRQALAIGEDLGDQPALGSTYHELGHVAYRRGLLAEAENWYRQALAIKEDLGDRPTMAGAYHQLGMTAQARGLLAEAEDWYRQALAIKEDLGDRPHVTATYHQLGRIAQDRGQLAEAEDWYFKALAISEDLGNRPGMALTYGQLGLLAEAQRQPHQALNWMVSCVSLFDQFPHPATGPGPIHLARFTQMLGMDALEQSWQHVTGQSVPQAVRNYITSQNTDHGALEALLDRFRRRRRPGRRRDPRP